MQSIAHKASGLSHSLLKASVCRSKEFMIFLLVTHIHPVLEYSAWLWYTGYVNDTRLLEKVQRQWTKQIEGLSDLSYADRLKFLNLYSVQGRLLRADLLQYWKILNGLSSIVLTYIFQLSPETRTRGYQVFSPIKCGEFINNENMNQSLFVFLLLHAIEGAINFGTPCVFPPT